MSGIIQALLASFSSKAPYRLYTWGGNTSGQLGHNDRIARSSPVQVGSSTDWEIISASALSTASASVKTDGSLWTWGDSFWGSNGHGDTISRSSPTQVGALTNWSTVDINSGFCAAIKTDGTLWTWGKNSFAALGQNDTTNRSSPVQVGALINWAQVSTGSNDSCLAVKTDGTLWAWGKNERGELGLNNRNVYSSPTQVGALTNWSKALVAQGTRPFTAACKTDGTFWTWGSPFGYALGRGTGEPYRSSPVQLGALTTWTEEFGQGGNNCSAIKSDGTLWTWGANTLGELARTTSSIFQQASPVQVGALTDWDKISIKSGCFAIKTGGTFWSWGSNGSGALGINLNNNYPTKNRSSPVQVGSATDWYFVNGSSGIRKG